MTTDSNIVETTFNTKDGYNECDHCQSVLSPAAYFVKLVETVEKYISGHKLKERRPDLFELSLDCNSTNKTKLYLEIANEIMGKNLNSKLGLGVYGLRKLENTNQKIKTYLKSPKVSYENLHRDLSLAGELGISYEDCKSTISKKEDLEELAKTKYSSIDAYLKKHNVNYEDLYKKLNLVKTLDISKEDYQLITSDILQKLATTKYSFNLPANFPLVSIRAYLEKQGITLADVYKVLEPEANNVAESLTLSPEEYKVIIDATDPNVQEVYGANANELQKVEKFITQTNIDSDKLNRLVDCYNKLKNPSQKIYAGLEDINNLDNQALGFLHRFILASKLNWSFDELSDALIEQKEINAESLKEISKIKNLQKKLNKPLIEVCKLYSQTLINSREEYANSAAESLFFLQGIKDSQLKQEYGIDEPSEPFKEQSIGEFITQNEMKREQVERLLSNYNSGQFTYSSKKIETINTKEQRFLHNFTQLTKRLALLFDKLSKNEFKLSDTVLQKIWNISDNELISLINYNDQVSSEKGKSLILKVHKQILLARLMNISISEMIQILLHLNIDEVNTSNTENIVELNDWLNKNSLTIEQFNRLVNASALSHEHTEKISKIEEELKKSEDLESEKKLDLLLNDEGLTVQVKDKIRKALEKPEIKKLKSTEKLNVLTRDSEFGTKVKGKLEVLKSKDILDALMKDSELGTKVKSILEELSSKEKLDKLINDSTIVEKDEIKKIIKSKKLNSKEKLNKLEFDSTLLEEYKTIINEIRERINEIRERREELHNEIHKYCNVGADVLVATHQFTKKHGTNLQLLRLKDSNKNVDVAIIGNKAIFLEEEKKDSVKVKMDKPRKNMAVAVIGTQTIFFGGKEDEKVSNKIDIYDAKTEKWTEHTASEGRENASVAVVNKQVIFFGGSIVDKQYSKQVDIYNSTNNSWTTHINGESYDNVSVAIVGTKAIFFTEKKDNKKISQVYIYDSMTKSWVKREGKKSSESSLNRTINSIKHCEKIDIYDNKAWKAIDIYKPDERNEIEIENDRVYITSSNNDETIYSIKLSITYDATVEELLNNTDVFNTLNLNAEDIKNITNYANIYNLKGTWTEKQIKMLTNYKTLQNVFSGNEFTLSQYTDWLSNSYEENKVTEKIAQLTNWNKKLLDDIKKIETFKQCFEKENNPIDSLTKLKCFIDMEEKSGIAGNILLELKDLHNLSASTGWKKYLDTEEKLKESLSYVEGVKERLENCKRDILANYMLHKYSEIKNKNMRGLYAFLLIDVEMSDCSKVSPLKAGLNSLQLYIHRCILGLEEGATVSAEFTEEMWDLLDNYREWEVTKKIALYPENYLNPMLRKSATAEYKELQNTLMQGNLTEELAKDAYIKYFEDFSQLVNLKIVDTYFADNKLYILGRTISEPYTYYYRVANFGDQNEDVQRWLPWKKIEVQIPVSIARIIYVFGRIFIFWLQKTDKEKQIEDVSINDSTLGMNYIFQKVDGSYSAQQRLSYSIEIDKKFEIEVKKCLDIRNWNKKTLDEYKGKKDKKVGYLQHNIWVKDKDIDEAKCYFEKEIEDWDTKLKEEVEKAKKITEKIYGKLMIILQEDEKLSILSYEEGFQGCKVILDEEFQGSYSKTTEQDKEAFKKYKNESYVKILENIAALSDQKIKEYFANLSSQEDALNAGVTTIGQSASEENTLKNSVDSKKKQREFLQSGIGSIKIDDLEQEAKNIEKVLDQLPQNLKGNLEKIPVEQGKIQEAIDNLGERSKSSKQEVEKVLAEQLSKIEKEEGNLQKSVDLFNNLGQKVTVVDNRKKLNDEVSGFKSELKQDGIDQAKKDTLNAKIKLRDDIIKEFSDTELHLEIQKKLASLEGNITTIKEKIKKLKDIELLTSEIEQLEKQIKEKSDAIEKLQEKKTCLGKDIGTLKQEIENKLKESKVRKDKDIAIVYALLYNESDLLAKKEINLVNKLYIAAYVQGPKAILAPKEEKEKLDFDGFYGVYLREMFFHIPTLIAYLFNQEQKFADARKWYQYIFNPLKKGCDAWQFIPFKAKCPPSSIKDQCDSGKLVDSLDPYNEADKKKTSHEKYTIMSYVDNLIDWGDMLFSQASWEGINQATMLYIRAWDLLGEKPKKKGKHQSEPKNVHQISCGKIKGLCKAETMVPSSTNQDTQSTPSSATSGTIEYCIYFCTPENKEFINLWNRIEGRLYKIRHCLDIKGKRLELSLFQPPIDPKQLVSAAAGGSTIRLPKIAQVPHYRFKYMITYAKSIADTVTQIGSELLSVLEKKDAEALTLLYNKQEGIMANLMTTIKEKSIEALKEDAKALNASLSSAKDRKSHYEKLINDGLSGSEIAAIGTSIAAVVLLAATVSPKLTAAILNLMPNIFGLACGGHDPGRSADTAASSIQTVANVLSNTSQNISMSASYERRAQDWGLQKIMATHDTEQIGYQIEVNKINQANAIQDLRAHKESIKQIKEKESFFRGKFTNQELYSWMKGELKSLYIKTYRLALEIAKQAEWAYQYEIDNGKAFIQPGHWNSLKEGLLSGQKLKFELEQLDKEYHDTNERRLEITKVISLKSLDPIALHELKTKGSCKFSFTEKLFDLDFPGHYARKIKDIKITIPAVVGPYENVHASLQQTSSQVILKSDSAINAIKYLVNPSEEEQPETDLLRVNWKPNQEIAISKADQDSGLFELSFGDERYLPFEGTGAVSTWELSLPQATNRFDIGTISDVIIHLDYTALNGGEALSSQVKNLNQLKYYLGTLVANLSSVYPAEWDKFKQQAKGSSSELKFKLSPEIFPIHVKNSSADLNRENNIYVIPTTSEINSRMTIKLNNYNWERNSKKIVNPSLTIGSDWSMKINNADTHKIEEITIMVPYKAMINW